MLQPRIFFRLEGTVLACKISKNENTKLCYLLEATLEAGQVFGFLSDVAGTGTAFFPTKNGDSHM